MIRIFVLALLACGALPAQNLNTLVSETRFQWTTVRDNLLQMAEKMPAENYSFQPVPAIQTFAQRLAHIAGANLFVCRGVLGEDATLRLSAAALVLSLSLAASGSVKAESRR